MRRVVLLAWVLGPVVLGAAGQTAHADKARSLEIYAEGKAKYQAGDYTGAIDLFEQAYAEHPSAAYLFNSAQSYRQLSDCPNALRMYRRFVEVKPDGKDAAKPHIDELTAQCGDQVEADQGDSGASGNDTKIAHGEDGGPSDASAVIDDANASGDSGSGSGVGAGSSVGGSVTPTSPRGPILSLTAEAGASFFNVGDVVTPVAATIRIGAAYPLDVGPVTLELGAVVELAPMPYEDAAGESTATWTTLLANAAVVYPIGKIRVGGELGLGVLMVSSLELGNPFTDQMEAAGSGSSFGVRVGGSVDYELFSGLAASMSPAFVYAGAADGFREEISSVTRIELLGGVRYRW